MSIIRYSGNCIEGPYIEFADTQYTPTFRTNGPCEIQTNGNLFFSQITAKSHNRIQGPSRIFADGTVQFTNESGKIHRTDRPAIIFADGTVEYWIDNEYLSADKFFLQYGVM